MKNLSIDQHIQLDEIIDAIEKSEVVDYVWNALDHDITDTIDGDQYEPGNFQGDLQEFIFRWVMGEKLPKQ